MSDLRTALEPSLSTLFGGPTQVVRLDPIGGGASMEIWALDAKTPQGLMELIVRRAAGGRIYTDALSLEDEHKLIAVAHAGGVRVPRPFGYLPDLLGREAFVMERLQGETVGRRIVQRPELAKARAALPAQMALELSRIHALDRAQLSFLPVPDPLATLRAQLDALDEPHPAIELGLFALERSLPRDAPKAVCHGDFRVGNLMVQPDGLAGVLDWEFAHLGDAREDLGWLMVKAWRFRADDLRLGGIGTPGGFLERYGELTGRAVSEEEIRPFELLGNVRWAVGALSQARRHLSGEERSVELAVLGRLACEMEHEILQLVEGSAR